MEWLEQTIPPPVTAVLIIVIVMALAGWFAHALWEYFFGNDRE